MEALLRRVRSVGAVEVSLERKLARVHPDKGNTLTMEDLRQALAGTRYSVKSAELEIAGSIERRDGRDVLLVSHSRQVYRLADGKDAEGKNLTGLAERLAKDAATRKDQVLVVTGVHEDAPPPTKDGEKTLPPLLRVSAYRFEAPQPAPPDGSGGNEGTEDLGSSVPS